MTRAVMVISVVACVLAIQAVASETGKGRPPANGPALWSYIAEEHPYREWDTWPGYPGMYPGNSPHGAHLKLYANKVAIRDGGVLKTFVLGTA